jgi:hypothetical protein
VQLQPSCKNDRATTASAKTLTREPFAWIRFIVGIAAEARDCAGARQQDEDDAERPEQSRAEVAEAPGGSRPVHRNVAAGSSVLTRCPLTTTRHRHTVFAAHLKNRGEIVRRTHVRGPPSSFRSTRRLEAVVCLQCLLLR